MTRLNVKMRKDMANKAVEVAGVPAELAVLVKRRAALAEAIRVDSLGGLEGIATITGLRSSLETTAQNPLLKNVSGFEVTPATKGYELYHINLGGMRVTLQYNGEVSEHAEKRLCKSPVPRKVTYDAESEFTAEFLAIESEYKDLTNKREGLLSQVLATLNQFTTVKNLLAAWPEAVELLPAVVPESSTQLPVVQVKDLNCLLGLPTGEEHA